MKPTGMLRRIDELGRIVIPKEIRKSMRIKNGENLEILVDNDEIVLKKYSQVEKNIDFIKPIIEILNNISNFQIFVTDLDNFIVAPNNYDMLLNQKIGHNIIKIIESRETFKTDTEIRFDLTSEIQIYGFIYIVPVIVDSDCVGTILIFGNEKCDIIKYIGKLLEKLIEKKLIIN